MRATTRLAAQFLVPLLALATLSCGARPHQSLDSRAEPLRSAFNADSGSVRVVILASPT
jgi:hypothetical protein